MTDTAERIGITDQWTYMVVRIVSPTLHDIVIFHDSSLFIQVSVLVNAQTFTPVSNIYADTFRGKWTNPNFF